MKWLLGEVISKARDLQFLFGRQDIWTWRILSYFDMINRLVSDEKKKKKNLSETRWKWLDFPQWQTGDRISSIRRTLKRILGPATWPKENSGISDKIWLEIRPPVAHSPGIWFPDLGSTKSVWFQLRAKENVPSGLTRGLLLWPKGKEISVTSSSDWKSDSLSLTWAPTVQAGPASEISDVTIAFYTPEMSQMNTLA